MNFQSVNIPSVVERYSQPLIQVAANPEKCIQLYESGAGYLIGELALSKTHNLGMKNEHMVNQSFQNGKIVLDRKRKDLEEIRRNHLANYYDEVLSPTFKKAFTDSDFEKANTIYLVGGGARYPDLVDCFKHEFDGILNIVVPEEAENMASLGYCLRSAQWCGPGHLQQAVGLDIGNAYTVVTQPEAKQESVITNVERPELLGYS